MKIGLFDSGVGGLTIMDAMVRALPEYDYLYLGDVGRAPYSGREHAMIARYTEQGVQFLFDQGATLVIIACNTACTVALRVLQETYIDKPKRFDRRILGIVVPTVEAVAHRSATGQIGLFATETTIKTHVYDEELRKCSQSQLTSVACPLLVPIVEEGWHQTPTAWYACKEYVSRMKNTDIDTVVLGCTHYPFLKHYFRELLPRNVELLEQGPLVAEATVSYLQRHPELAKQLSLHGTRTFYTTGSPERFADLGSRLFQHAIGNVIRVAEMPMPLEQIHKALQIID